jgi:hypothetical protein
MASIRWLLAQARLELYIRWMQEVRRFKALDGVAAVLGHRRVLAPP